MDIIEKVKAMRAEVRAEYEATTKRAEELRAILASMGEDGAPSAPAVSQRHATRIARSSASSADSHKRYRHREENYRPLITAITETLRRVGPVETTLRDLCKQHKEAWLQCLPNQKKRPNARGFACVVYSAYRRTDCVLLGVLRIKMIATGGANGDHGDSAIYRAEAV